SDLGALVGTRTSGRVIVHCANADIEAAGGGAALAVGQGVGDHVRAVGIGIRRVDQVAVDIEGDGAVQGGTACQGDGVAVDIAGAGKDQGLGDGERSVLTGALI